MTVLLALTATLVAYQAALNVNRRAGGHPLLNRVLLAIIALGALLALTGVKYRAYFQGAQAINLLLGPAVVALAVPLHRQLSTIRRSAPAVLSALAIGSLAAIASAVAISEALGASASTVLSLAPKSATAAVAIGISRQLGGVPSLTAALTISTGIIGAILGPGLLARLNSTTSGPQDWRSASPRTGSVPRAPCKLVKHWERSRHSASRSTRSPRHCC